LTQIDDNKYYCSQKFTWLSVEIEKRLSYSCCSATPHKIDLLWLKDHPGQLFNTELLQLERQQMLDNIPVASCETACWTAEKNGLDSRRILQKTNLKTYTDKKIISPTTLNIILGSTCNLTCSYCCKQYSSAWRKDIVDNGSYLDQDRFTLNNQDKILHKISQSKHADTDSYKFLLDTVSDFNCIETVYISGGEPFLYNNLPTLVNKFVNVPKVIVVTGLGISPKRFLNQLEKIRHNKNLQIEVSGENCEHLYEFNRYNNSWSRFLTNLSILKEKEFGIKFSMVISNLTVFGFKDFYQKFQYEEKQHNWCTDPSFLSVNVLDDLSKEQIIKQLQNETFDIKDQLISSIKKPCSEQQRKDFSIYLSEFSKRRKLDLDIFPASMLQWLNLKDNYVV
jgi:organic radical activating enzyme